MRVTAPNRNRSKTEENWPDHVWGIGLDRLDYLGVDGKGRLYWNGDEIVTKTVRLTMWQRVGAFLVTVSAIVAASGAGISAYYDYKAYKLEVAQPAD